MVNKWQVRNDFSKGDVMKRWYVVCAVVALGMRLIYPAAIARDTLVLAVQELKRTRVGGVKDAVKRYAEQAGYGYKTANLVELKMLSQAFNTYKDNATLLAVPEFRGVASEQIQRVLREQEFDCVARWEAVVKTLPANVAETKTFPAEFLAARQKFSDELQEAWQRVVGAYAAQEATPLNEFFATDGLDELVTSVTAAGSRFMVRSTGKEDTAELANAGGNESIANVEPAPKALLQAIGSVVLSYFGLKSLTQRLSLGDETVTLPEVFTPVLLQAMVGEQADDAQPPRCGVMFTQEAEGAIVPDDKTYSTTGITLIQAAYGHNEGVVKSIIPVDTYYVMDKPDSDEVSVYPVVRNKIDRLVPEAAGMVRVTNSKEQAQQSALSRDEIITLKEFGWALEAYYDCAMDVEFVFKDNTFSIVQARPIVHKRPDLSPSYIASPEKYTSFKGSTISAAGGAVRSISRPAELLVAPTIEAALDAYLKSSFNRAAVQAIVVGAMAPSTSHAATTFRNEGKPVLYITDYETLKPMLDEGMMLLISPQQNAVFQVPANQVHAEHGGGGVAESKGGDDDVITMGSATQLIRQGWISYPVPRALSLQRELIGCDMNVQPGAVQESRQVAKLAAWSELLGRMKKEKQSEVQIACARYIAQLARLLKAPAAHGTFKDELQTVFDVAASLCKDIVAVAAIKPDASNYTARLLPIRMLEALTYQQLDRQDVVQALSLASFGKALRQEKAIAVEMGTAVEFGSDEARDYYMQLQKINDVIYAPAVKKQWLVVTKMLAEDSSAHGIKRLALLVADLHQFKLLPIWLHTVMVRDVQAAHAEGVVTTAALTDLINGWERPLTEAADFLKQVKKISERITSFRTNEFEMPSKFNVLFASLEKLRTALMAPEFTEPFKSVNPTAKIAACFMLTDFIELFDQCIKAMKGSSAYKQDEQAACFKSMLIASNQWLVHVFSEFVPANAIKYPRRSPLARYLILIKRLVTKKFTQADLLPTPGVDVFNFSIGSGHDFVEDSNTNKQPQSGEDVFSIIHQSLINGIAACVVANNVGDLTRPEILSQAEGICKNISSNVYALGQEVKLVGLEARNDGITVIYNQPLGSHSCQMTLCYRHKTNDVVIKLQFAGGMPVESFRWKGGAAVMLLAWGDEVLNKALTPRLVALSDHMLIVTCIFDSADNTSQLTALWSDLLNCATADSPFVVRKIVSKYMDYKLNVNQLRKILVQLDISQRDYFKIVLKECELAQLKALVEKGQGVAEAIAAAQAGIVSTNYEVFLSAIDLFKALVEKGQGVAEAIAAAQAGIASTEHYVRSLAIDLFKALVEKGQGVAEAIAAAQAGMVGTVYNVRSVALALFKVLLEKGQGVAEAIAAAQAGIASPNYEVGSFAFTLFKALFEKGQGYAEAIAAAQAGIVSTDHNVRCVAIDLFRALVEKGQGYAEAIAVAQAGMVSTVHNVRCVAIGLFRALVEKGQGYAEAIAVAQAGIVSTDHYVRSVALALFKVLLEKGQGYAEAEYTANYQDGDLDYVTETKQALRKELATARARQAGGGAA
jgi:hypothetical protein